MKKVTITMTEEQAKAVEIACHCYGRLKMFQFDIVYDDIVGKYNYDEAQEFEKLCKAYIFNKYPELDKQTYDKRDGFGDIVFEIHRGIHAHFHNASADKHWCVTCGRADLNLSGQPVIEVKKVEG